MYEIEKNIPIVGKYPFDKMEVGDSFYVEGDKNSKANLRMAAFTYRKKVNVEFATKSDDKGIRIWRTA